MSDNAAFTALAAALGNVDIIDLTVPLAEGLAANWPPHFWRPKAPAGRPRASPAWSSCATAE
jgi:hypothetical protein